MLQIISLPLSAGHKHKSSPGAAPQQREIHAMRTNDQTGYFLSDHDRQSPKGRH
ncbi:MAG: hypothetical protein IBX47_11400 [Desulfuromonadales bacterium]|nr:hypothetical protein [Desulfuromonadales bacterium]